MSPEKWRYSLKKKSISLILTLALVISMIACILPAPADAAGSDSFQFTYCSRENITLSLNGGELIIGNLPDTTAFRSLVIYIVNESGRIQSENLLDRNSDGCASLSLRNLQPGKYYIELYFYTGGSDYSSYVFGDDVVFQWNDGAGAFVDSPTLEHNSKTYQNGRSDNAALANYLMPSYGIQCNDAAIVSLASEITSGMTGDYEKAMAIHDWVCSNLWYDCDAAESGKRIAGDAVSAMNSLRAVCEGYATLTAALLRAVNIPAKTVNGYGLNASDISGWTQRRLSGAETNHSWNEAYINDRWIIIDTTWDCGNEYRGGRQAANDGLYTYRYFDATVEAFSVDHRIDGYDEASIPPPDDPSSWALLQVNEAISEGLVPQLLRVKYTQAATHVEFCALGVALYETVTGSEIAGRVKFNDTSDINVEKLASIGVVTGVGSNIFDPNSKLTREQAAVILVRLAEALGIQLPTQAASFADNSQISSWAIAQVGQVQTVGIMGGVGSNTFAPKNDFTREQCIITLYRLYTYGS